MIVKNPLSNDNLKYLVDRGYADPQFINILAYYIPEKLFAAIGSIRLETAYMLCARPEFIIKPVTISEKMEPKEAYIFGNMVLDRSETFKKYESESRQRCEIAFAAVRKTI